MRSNYWTFVEMCDEARSVHAIKDLLGSAARTLGFDTFLLTTHAPRRDLRSLNVLVHNWSPEAVEHLNGRRLDGTQNPIFESTERTAELLPWASKEWRAVLRKDQRIWLDRLGELVPGAGVSKAMQSTVVNASCSVSSQDPFDGEQVRTWMRIANHAYHSIQYLQKPQLSEPEKLTAREHECLYRAAVFGERPSAVARRLGVKVSTIRTLRQKAYGRLDADSPEQAVWRMMETGQLFRRGRKSKPRTR